MITSDATLSVAVVTTLVGGGGKDYVDGVYDAAFFNQPTGITIHSDGNRLFVGDSGNNGELRGCVSACANT